MTSARETKGKKNSTEPRVGRDFRAGATEGFQNMARGWNGVAGKRHYSDAATKLAQLQLQLQQWWWWCGVVRGALILSPTRGIAGACAQQV